MDFELNKLNHGLSYEEYAAVGGLRAGELKHLKRSPAHYKVEKENPKEPTEALEFGKKFHSLIENGKDFLDSYIVMPEFTGYTKDGKESKQSKEAKDKKANWLAGLSPQAIVVTQEEMNSLVGMINACLKHKRVSEMIRHGVRETSLFVEDPDTGLLLQCRPDLITEHGHMLDFKTTRDASPSFFKHQIFSERTTSPFYTLGSAHYAHCGKIAKVCKENYFIIVAIEKEEPYCIMVYPLDIGCLGPGEQWRSKLTKEFAECKAKDEWPGYPEDVVPVTPPQYVSVPEDEEYEEEEEVL